MGQTNTARRNKEGRNVDGSVSFGQALMTLRIRREKTLKELSREIGGEPGESYLWRIEQGTATPSPTIVVRLARALGISGDKLLNAIGWATAAQQAEGIKYLAKEVGEPEPIKVTLPVLDPESPGLPPAERAVHMLRRREEGFVVRLSAPQNRPYVGEIIAVYRPPQIDQGVIVERNGRLTAWTFRGTFLENGDGDRLEEGFEIRGSIIRVIGTVYEAD